MTFAAVLIRREVFDLVGPLDERYWYGYEDVDYCLTARRAGVEVLVCADARVTHDECQTRGRGIGDAENAVLFREKWPDLVPVA